MESRKKTGMDTNEDIDSKSFDKVFMKVMMIFWTNYTVSPIFYYVQNEKRLAQWIILPAQIGMIAHRIGFTASIRFQIKSS